MVRAALSLLTGVAALACCAQAYALGTATATTSLSVIEPAGINVVSAMVMPTVSVTSVGNSGFSAVGSTSAVGTGATGGGASTSGNDGSSSPAGNATLTIRGQAGDAVSMAVPQSFTVVRTGGTDALTVKTNTNVEYGVPGDVMAGSVMSGNTMSVNVGGSISLSSNAQVTPGAYEGLLVVVVQYN